MAAIGPTAILAGVCSGSSLSTYRKRQEDGADNDGFRPSPLPHVCRARLTSPLSFRKTCQLFSEHNAGSDLAAVRTRVGPRGDSPRPSRTSGERATARSKHRTPAPRRRNHVTFRSPVPSSRGDRRRDMISWALRGAIDKFERDGDYDASVGRIGAVI